MQLLATCRQTACLEKGQKIEVHPQNALFKRALEGCKRRLAQKQRTLQTSSTIKISRCLLSHNPTFGPYLTELHLQGIGVETRFGRYFRFMPHLKHLRIDKPLDTWHLQLVDKHFSSHLISLVIKVSETLQLISKNMLQLEHLELHMFDNHIKDLECLYLLQQLSSLRLVIITEGDVNVYWSLDNFYCGDENGTLETFYCTIRSISSIKDVTASLHTIYYLFCEKLADILLETNSTHSAELQRRQREYLDFKWMNTLKMKKMT
uniref:Uncharacterized protein n=1 Tax=Ditylenchus dipsaci TaxID=166011 RepID=A0A915DR69_9BILA